MVINWIILIKFSTIWSFSWTKVITWDHLVNKHLTRPLRSKLRHMREAIACARLHTCLTLQRSGIWHMSFNKKMSLKCVGYRTSQLKRFPNLLKKELAKENNVLNLVVCFSQVKVLVFSFETHKNELQMVENLIKIIQYMTIFSEVTFLPFLSFIFCTLVVK